ncbi:glycosyltransferase [Sphingomonas rustica]|uniref:glycosyltransferase n=1 Tax=Sphingomonas rustica TaxID=3103142 RepID=UPI0031FC0FA3
MQDPRRILCGSTLSLDSFCNSFFAAYWLELTVLDQVLIRLETTGYCRLRVIRAGADGQRETVVSREISGDNISTECKVALRPAVAPPGRLFIEIDALAGSVILHEGHWGTAAKPTRPVRLALATCCYAAGEMVLETLRRLAPTILSDTRIVQVIVVDQAPDSAHSPLPIGELAASHGIESRLQYVRQPNLGGSGGFARGMIEALAADATHVLLMDDDIRLDPNVIVRLVAILGYLEHPVTLGGQMLDMTDPLRLHASHENVEPEAFRLRNPCHGMRLDEPDTLDAFAIVHRSDYAGWWFCCIPTVTIEAAGLPLPLFVRHDDVEFGLRTSAMGSASWAMPGLFVWHASSAARPAPTYAYYDHRNRMIAAMLHGNVTADRLADQHAGATQNALLAGRLDLCLALCRAADDFLSGPEKAFAGLEARHQRLVGDLARALLLSVAAERLARQGGSAARSSVTQRIDGLCKTLQEERNRTVLALTQHAEDAGRRYRTEAGQHSDATKWRSLFNEMDASGGTHETLA